MKTDTPVTIRRSDYAPPAFLVDTVALDFDLDPASTTVRARLALRRNPAAPADAPLHLDGDGLTLVEAKLDGAVLEPARLAFAADGSLSIAGLPDAAVLETLVRIAPEKNTPLSGLYTSGGGFFTQCEAEGFRRITFFLDRPDVMARYTVTIRADKAALPGAALERQPGGAGDAGAGPPLRAGTTRFRSRATCSRSSPATWSPSRTASPPRSGRDVPLQIYVRRGDDDAAAMRWTALKRSMTWDEERFGLEYDLDVFMIVAVSRLQHGGDGEQGPQHLQHQVRAGQPGDAPPTPTSQRIESVVGHEYFHNWTGNRVTCRDWFQLSPEGRPDGLPRPGVQRRPWAAARSSASATCAACARRSSPRTPGRWRIRCGPTATSRSTTSTRPRSTRRAPRWCACCTRGSAPRPSARGMDLYFERHDGQAVTSDDFVQAMQDASGIDLQPFKRWYDQAGTPELTASDQLRRGDAALHADAAAANPADARASPRSIRCPSRSRWACSARMARRCRCGSRARTPRQPGTRMLLLEGAEQIFTFDDVPAPPVPSLLRGFSAPVRLRGVTRDRLRFLAVHDTDPFVRWESGLQYATSVMLEMVAAQQRGEPLGFDTSLAEAVANTLVGAATDPAFAAEALSLPGEGFLADQMEIADPVAIHAVRQHLRAEIGQRCGAALRATYDWLADDGPYRIDGTAIGRRALRNACLAYLTAAGDAALARMQFDRATNMTDSLAALSLLADTDGPARDQALATFHARWRGDDLVLDKWFSIQAMAARPDAIAAVRALYAHPDFDLKNPNRARSLIGAFASGNPSHFHDLSGRGLSLPGRCGDRTRPDQRLRSPRGWSGRSASGGGNRAARGTLMRRELQRVLDMPNLSQGHLREGVEGAALAKTHTQRCPERRLRGDYSPPGEGVAWSDCGEEPCSAGRAAWSWPACPAAHRSARPGSTGTTSTMRGSWPKRVSARPSSTSCACAMASRPHSSPSARSSRAIPCRAPCRPASTPILRQAPAPSARCSAPRSTRIAPPSR